MNTASLRKAEKALVACHSFKGHDFFESPVARSPKSTRWAKRFTARAARRLNKAVARVSEEV
jgi:hypothetical protein